MAHLDTAQGCFFLLIVQGVFIFGRLKDSTITGTDAQKVHKPESEQARGEGRDTSKRSTG